MMIDHSFRVPVFLAVTCAGMGLSVAAADTAPDIRPPVNLVSDTAENYDVLGVSLALGDNTLVAGAPGLDLIAANAGGAVLFSREGVAQGDPLSMALYGIGLLPLGKHLRVEHPRVLQPWFADNLAAMGVPGDIVDCLVEL